MERPSPSGRSQAGSGRAATLDVRCDCNASINATLRPAYGNLLAAAFANGTCSHSGEVGPSLVHRAVGADPSMRPLPRGSGDIWRVHSVKNPVSVCNCRHSCGQGEGTCHFPTRSRPLMLIVLVRRSIRSTKKRAPRVA
jgi:hypothetical protein